MSDAIMMGWAFVLGAVFTLVIMLISRAMFDPCGCDDDEDEDDFRHGEG